MAKGILTMYPSFRWITFLLVLALALPGYAADEKKDAKKKKDDVEEKDKDKKGAKKKDKDDEEGNEKAKARKEAEKLLTGPSFIGTLTKMSGNSQKDFTVQLTFKYREINQQAVAQYAQQQAQLRQRYVQALQNRNPYQRQQQLAQIQAEMARVPQNLYSIKEIKKDIDLKAADDIKVRTLQPPIDYDDKGNVKKYTAKELKELKGTGNLPGYTAEFDSLRNSQIVKVYLKKGAVAPNKKAMKKGKKKKKDDEDDDEDLDVEKPEAVLVIVLQEPPPDKN